MAVLEEAAGEVPGHARGGARQEEAPRGGVERGREGALGVAQEPSQEAQEDGEEEA